MSLISRIKRSFAEGLRGPGRFRAAGKLVVCLHCDGEIFERHHFILDRILVAKIMENASLVLKCSQCGLLHWFCAEVERVAER